ncbi:hypothetical protein C8J57DRAFT_1235438 [Mycena rebaudengoi]|nr:hypothetical protein C8J57DRAFT_1235438 [Mycena rebaudengoi]
MGHRAKAVPHRVAAAALAHASRASRRPSGSASSRATAPSTTISLPSTESDFNLTGSPEASGNCLPPEPDSHSLPPLNLCHPEAPDSEYIDLEPNEDECCSWDGGVNHSLDSDEDWVSAESSDSAESDSDSDLLELEGEPLVESLRVQMDHEIAELARATPYEEITKGVSHKQWRKAETNRSLGYNGQAP